jgi:AraC-like DNA-binding protein
MNQQYSKQYLYRQIVAAKLFIDDNFSDRIDLKSMADEACFSKFHFNRLFKEIYFNTPNQYLTKVRISRAKQLLETEMTVRDVCFAIGFESVSTFKGLFKKLQHQTPSGYKKAMLARKHDLKKKPLKYFPSCISLKNLK